MTWVDRLALKYRGLIWLLRVLGGVNAAVLIVMLQSAAAHPTALLLDSFPALEAMFDVWGSP